MVLRKLAQLLVSITEESPLCKEDRYLLNIDTALVFCFCFSEGSCILFIPITLPH